MVVGEPKRSIMEGIENTGDVRLHDHRLRLKQRFDIIRKLGQGTYGKVQLGINKKTGQEVAIKTIKKCKIETEADLVRIRREVQIMSSVRHPNIVHIYEVFENSEKMILVMEYCAGGELYDYLSQQKVLQEDEARRLFRQIATAVYYCHKHKICHRDLKLENVLLDEHGSAKIADFGLSNVFEERRLLATFCGSPLYASPEIVKGTPYIGPEVDCWSLGVLLYTLVYGAMPFDGSNFKRLVKQISTGDYFEPKTPSSASPLIRDMLTVDPIQRADITHICDNPWVNKGSDVSCLELAEALANETPVRLDLLLSLAPPPIHGSDKLLVTDEIKAAPSDSSPTRSMSLANIENSAERRILEMVAEGGTDAIKPSPTRTIVGAEQPKRKLEPAVSMDSAPSQRKKERTLRSSSKVNQAPNEPEPASMVAAEANEVENQEPVEQAAAVAKQESPSKAIKAEKEAISDAQPPQTNNTTVVSPKQTPEKSPPRKSMDKENSVRSASVENKAASEDTNGNDYASAPKQPTERRRSRILDAAEKLNNLSIQPGEAAGQLEKPKPKKVIIPDTISSAPNYLKKGVSVGSFKEQFERRASLTAANNTGNEVKKIPNKFTTPATMKSLADKKLHSLDSEHPPASVENKDPSSNVRLQTIGVEPSQPMKKEVPVAQPVEAKKPGPPESNRVTKPLHKSESLKEPSASRDNLQSSMSLEDARRSLQQSMALINQAKSDMAPGESSDDVSAQQQDRQSQLKTAREIISHAIGDDSNGKKVHRICMGGKPPVPYGSGGRSASGSISLGSLPGSPPVSPPGPLSPPLPPAMARPRDSPARTFRTEVQHRVDDVRNKFVPTSRGGSVERIIPIQFAEEAPKPQSHSGQLPYQRNNTMPYRLSSLPRGCISDNEVERTPPPQTPQSSVPSTPLSQSRAEPIKKSPREFIIPIAVEGVGYVTPRQGSLEPSETPSKLNPQGLGFASRFPKPRRISSLVSGGESEDEEDLHMHRLRSSRRTRAEPEKESVSSGEEDDDEGFELLTADNLFSTLLNRVCSLTNRLNGEEGTGFPQHHQSLFNNLHSPFFNSPHLPRKHKRHNIVRDGPSWRRSTSRDIASDFDSMFPNHPPFPRGSKKSSRRAASSKSGTSETSSNNQDTDNHSLPNDSDKNKHLFDLPDLDLSKMELSEKEVETLSGLTPALSRRLQKQLLAHLPPAAARSLRQTLSMNCPHMSDDRPSQHKYTRSLSANKTTLPEEDFNRNENIPIDSSNVNEDRTSQLKYTRSLSANKTTLSEEDFNKNGNVPIDCSNVSKDRASQRKYTRSLSANKTTLPEESFDENENMPINNCPNVSEDRTSQHKYTRSLSANKTTLLEASVDKNENMPINCSNASEDRTSQHKYTRSLSDNKKTLPEETFDKNDNTSVNSSHASEDRSSQHKYTRSLSANRTTLPEESSDKSENLSSAADDSFLKTDLSGDNNNTHSKPVYEKYADDEDPSSISCASSKQENLIHSKADYSLPDLSDSSPLKNDRGRNGDATEDAYSAESITPRLLSSVRSTPDRSVLGKYFSDRPTLEDYSPLRSDYEGSSLLSEPSYLAAYGGSVSPLGSLHRRSLRTPPAETSKKRISRFLRPDFFDTPREESIYVREKKERELETQQVLKEIRQKERKKSRGLDPGSGLSSPLMSTDVTSLFDSANSRISSRNCLSPVSLTPRDRSRSITPFYPILDNINEVQNDYDSNRRIRETLMNIDKKVKQSNNNQGLQERNEYTMNNTSQQSESSNKGFDSVKESGGARPKSYSVESTNDNSFFKEEKKPSPDKASRGDSVVRESKLLRPKSYPSSSTSPEKHVTNIPVILTEPVACSQTCSNGNGEGNSRLIALDRNKSSSPMDRDSNGNITVSFNINLPSKTITKVQERVEEPTVKPPVEEKKKSPAKKKIIIKKKSASQKKVDAELQNGGETVKPANNVTPVKENKNGEQKVSPKRKSVLHSIGQKFEKFRNDSFSKSNSQEKEIPVEKPPKNVSEKEEPKLSRIENVMRALRERSVPPPSQAESITISSLIKRAVTVDDLPALDVKDTQNRTSVSRVLGLFKKNDSKDKTKCLENDTKEKNKSEDRGLSPEAEKEGAKVAQSEVSSSAAVPVDNKPKRPTSLLLNGIGKRVQACYSGATSDSVLVRGDKKPICKDDDPLVSNDSKDENKTSQKKGLRLDFSRLPILNQGLFNKRNSLDLSKQREGSESKESNEKAVNTSSENTTTGVMDAKVVKNGECNTEESHFRAESNNLSATPNGTDFSPSWSPDCDSYKHLSEAVDGNANQSLPQRFHEATSPDIENIEDRIRRKSFYSRFNEKKNQRRSTLVGPGAKEYIPSARIHPHTEVDRTLYSNKYDMSPTSSKYTASPLSLEHARLVHPLDKLECISPSTSRFKSYASDHKPGDKNDNRSSDSKFLDGNSYSIPRYTRTVSLFDNYDVRNNGNDTKAGNSRYGKSFSMMSPGSYATYSPRSHSRNSAILLRDSNDVKTDTESLLIKIRNRKKSAPANASFDEDVNLDSKIRGLLDNQKCIGWWLVPSPVLEYSNTPECDGQTKLRSTLKF